MALRPVAWSEKFRVGVASIDRDHRKIIDFLNTLAARGDESPDPHLIDALVGFARDHHALEEGFMEKYGYPNSAEHIEEHDLLRTKVVQLQDSDDDDAMKLAKMRGLLYHWLTKHLMDSEADMKLGKFLYDNGVY